MGSIKGSEFERLICKELTIWLTNKKKPYAFWRMPASGALATLHENQNLSGDIIGLTEEAKYYTNKISIECKTGYPNTSVWQHFKNIKNFGIKQFWKQCVSDALLAEKMPMLIYRRRGKQIIVGIKREDYNKNKRLLSKLVSMSIKFKNDELPEIIFFGFVDFFKNISPAKMKRFL